MRHVKTVKSAPIHTIEITSGELQFLIMGLTRVDHSSESKGLFYALLDLRDSEEIV